MISGGIEVKHFTYIRLIIKARFEGDPYLNDVPAGN